MACITLPLSCKNCIASCIRTRSCFNQINVSFKIPAKKHQQCPAVFSALHNIYVSQVNSGVGKLQPPKGVHTLHLEANTCYLKA